MIMIYSFDSDRLKLCFGKNDSLRPGPQAVRATNFSTNPGDRRTLVVLRRRPEQDLPEGEHDEATRLWQGNRITPEQPFPARVIGVTPSWVDATDRIALGGILRE